MPAQLNTTGVPSPMVSLLMAIPLDWSRWLHKMKTANYLIDTDHLECALRDMIVFQKFHTN